MENNVHARKAVIYPITYQMRIALQQCNRSATFFGMFIGSIVPIMVFASSHQLGEVIMEKTNLLESPKMIAASSMLFIMTLGGCIFSMKSVVQWGKCAFSQDVAKAYGYAILLEGMIVTSGIYPPLQWLGYVAVTYLTIINAISAGTNIAMDAKSHNVLMRELNGERKKSKRKISKAANISM